jgi:hypothetical protein
MRGKGFSLWLFSCAFSNSQIQEPQAEAYAAKMTR